MVVLRQQRLLLLLIHVLTIATVVAGFLPIPTTTIPSPVQSRQCRQQQETVFTTSRVAHQRKPFVSLHSSRTKEDNAVATAADDEDSLLQNHNDNLSRGDSRGAAVLLKDVSIFRGSNPLLQDIDWRIEPAAKWALIGSNGCGKSTLLKAIMGELPYDGEITIGTTQQVGYLQQTAVAGSTRTILEEASLALPEMVRAKQRMEKIEGELAESIDEDTTNRLLQAYDKAQTELERVGAYQQEQQVSTMLNGLGFTNLTQPCDELSGGWQMRVSFAKTLLAQPTLCLMDEPGNHLDRPARQWLANYLKQYKGGAMILVTHDVELLQAMDHICEVTPTGGIQLYKSCSYDQYLALKAQRQQSAMAEYEKNSTKAAKLQAFVDKFGASATKASAAQSRVKQLEKMQQQGLLDIPVVEQRFKPYLSLPEPPRSNGEVLLELKSASIGYSSTANGDAETEAPTSPLVQDVNLQIQRGMKILVRGPNGSGKSTLLHSLRGTLPLLSGDRVENQLLKLGVFTQDLAQELDGAARAVDLVTAYARDGYDMTISDESARGVLGGLGLTGEKALRQVQDLSGGEKARVALGMFALKPSNLYLLDEVSNHLDIEW